jgi:hypothetical protein
LILEKAYAKLHGSYSLIESGFPSEGLMDLTGSPCQTLNMSSRKIEYLLENDKFWPMLMSFQQRGAIISTSTLGTEDEKNCRLNVKDVGLVKSHAYTIIRFVEVLG